MTSTISYPQYTGKMVKSSNKSIHKFNYLINNESMTLSFHDQKFEMIKIRGVSELRIRIRIRGYPHEF